MKSDDTLTHGKKSSTPKESLRPISKLIAKHRGEVPTELCAAIRGSFNVCLRMKFLDGGSAIIRFPCRGYIIYPKEKVRNEVAVMRFIEEKTSIPVPHIFYYGMTDESP